MQNLNNKFSVQAFNLNQISTNHKYLLSYTSEVILYILKLYGDRIFGHFSFLTVWAL